MLESLLFFIYNLKTNQRWSQTRTAIKSIFFGGATSSSHQGLLLALCSEITDGRLRTIWDAENRTQVCTWKVTPCLLCYHPGPKSIRFCLFVCFLSTTGSSTRGYSWLCVRVPMGCPGMNSCWSPAKQVGIYIFVGLENVLVIWDFFKQTNKQTKTLKTLSNS